MCLRLFVCFVEKFLLIALDMGLLYCNSNRILLTLGDHFNRSSSLYCSQWLFEKRHTKRKTEEKWKFREKYQPWLLFVWHLMIFRCISHFIAFDFEQSEDSMQISYIYSIHTSLLAAVFFSLTPIWGASMRNTHKKKQKKTEWELNYEKKIFGLCYNSN